MDENDEFSFKIRDAIFDLAEGVGRSVPISDVLKKADVNAADANGIVINLQQRELIQMAADGHTHLTDYGKRLLLSERLNRQAIASWKKLKFAILFLELLIRESGPERNWINGDSLLESVGTKLQTIHFYISYMGVCGGIERANQEVNYATWKLGLVRVGRSPDSFLQNYREELEKNAEEVTRTKTEIEEIHAHFSANKGRFHVNINGAVTAPISIAQGHATSIIGNQNSVLSPTTMIEAPPKPKSVEKSFWETIWAKIKLHLGKAIVAIVIVFCGVLVTYIKTAGDELKNKNPATQTATAPTTTQAGR